MNKQRLLFIIPFLPYPLVSGGHQALYNGVASIADDYEVTIVYEDVDNDEHSNKAESFSRLFPQITLRPCLVQPVMQKKRLGILTILTYVKHKLMRSMGYHEHLQLPDPNSLYYNWLRSVYPLSPQLLSHIDNVVNETEYDIIQVEMPWYLSAILTLPKRPKKIYVHHELGFVRRSLQILDGGNNIFAHASERFCNMCEVQLLNMYDAVVTLSNVDAEKLRVAGVEVPIFPSFATVNSGMHEYKAQSDGMTLSFVGFGNHLPNRDGVRWFLEQCWDELQNINSDYRLNIIGNWSHELQMQIREKYRNVNFLGFVDDLYAATKGTIMIVPIRIGSGIRMKILEAVSNGIPFVTTSVGAEGIPVTSGENCFVADEPDTFINSIVRLCDVVLQQRFVDASQKMLAQRFSFEAMQRNRKDILQRVLTL